MIALGDQNTNKKKVMSSDHILTASLTLRLSNASYAYLNASFQSCLLVQFPCKFSVLSLYIQCSSSFTYVFTLILCKSSILAKSDPLSLADGKIVLALLWSWALLQIYWDVFERLSVPILCFAEGLHWWRFWWCCLFGGVFFCRRTCVGVYACMRVCVCACMRACVYACAALRSIQNVAFSLRMSPYCT